MQNNKANTTNTVFTTPIARRQLMLGLAVLPLPRIALAQNAPPIVLRRLNCFEIRVSDVPRSVAFYQDLFGMPVQARHGDRVCLRVGEGPQFMAIRRCEDGESPAITQLGYAVADFDLVSQQQALSTLGYQEIEAPALSAPGLDNAMRQWLRQRGETMELYFADARGVIVQLSGEDYCGGAGALGTECAAPEAAPEGMFRLHDINHFTAFVNDGAGANRYYQDTFGLEVQAYQGPNSPVTGIGDGYQFVMYAGPFPGGEDAPANLHHGCFNMDDFDEERILAQLTDYGLTAQGERQIGPLMHYVSRRQPDRGGAEGGTPELYFTDPDGILMQLQDRSYCGGGGYLGNECLADNA